MKKIKVVYEQTPNGLAELKFASAIMTLCESFSGKIKDCRDIAPAIRKQAETQELNMVVGCGGSHIYIHREHEFIEGNNTDPANVRWAIITEE